MKYEDKTKEIEFYVFHKNGDKPFVLDSNPVILDSEPSNSGILYKISGEMYSSFPRYLRWLLKDKNEVINKFKSKLRTTPLRNIEHKILLLAKDRGLSVEKQEI